MLLSRGDNLCLNLTATTTVGYAILRNFHSPFLLSTIPSICLISLFSTDMSSLFARQAVVSFLSVYPLF